MSNINLNFFGFLLLCVTLSGCSTYGKSRSISLSIEDLASEGVNRVDGKLVYRSAVTLTGISPPITTGRLLSVPGDGIPEQLSIPISTSCSSIIETLYDSDATLADVREIGISLETLRDKLTTKAEREIEAQLANAGKALVKEGNASTEVQKDLAVSIKNSLGLKELTPESIEEKEEALLNDINQLKIEADTITKDIITLKNRKNIYIFRWERLDSGSGGGTVIDLFSTTASQNESRQGYLIVASLRIAALEFGDDLMLKLVRDSKNSRTGSDAVLQNNYITNYSVGAKHIYFSEDKSAASAIASSLRTTPRDLKDLLGGTAEQIFQAKTIAIEASISASVASGARGLATEPKRKTFPFRMWGDAAFNASGEAERQRGQNYTVFYSTRSNVAELVASEAQGPKGVSAAYCMQMVPKSGKLATANHANLGFEFCSPINADESNDSSEWMPNRDACINFAKEIR